MFRLNDTVEIKQKIDELPEELKREVSDYIDFLVSKYERKPLNEKFDFSWEGGMSDSDEEWESVALQHKAREWR